MKANYDAKSFWSGVMVGTQLHGTTAYGSMPGWNPDGDLILRPITQGVPSIKFGADVSFVVSAMVDTVDEDTVFPAQELPEITQEIGAVVFAAETAFVVVALNERLLDEQVIQSYSIDKDINPLEYDDTIVFINSDGAFTMDKMTRSFVSTAAEIDIGTMQELTVTTGDFAAVDTQEVTAT